MKRKDYNFMRLKAIVLITIGLMSAALIMSGDVLPVHPLYIFAGAFTFMIVAAILIPNRDEALRRAEMDS